MCSLYVMPRSFLRHLISMACSLFSVSAVNVQDSQAYRNMDMTRERISLIFELSAIFLSFQMVLSFISRKFIIEMYAFFSTCVVNGHNALLMPLNINVGSYTFVTAQAAKEPTSVHGKTRHVTSEDLLPSSNVCDSHRRVSIIFVHCARCKYAG